MTPVEGSKEEVGDASQFDSGVGFRFSDVTTAVSLSGEDVTARLTCVPYWRGINTCPAHANLFTRGRATSIPLGFSEWWTYGSDCKIRALCVWVLRFVIGWDLSHVLGFFVWVRPFSHNINKMEKKNLPFSMFLQCFLSRRVSCIICQFCIGFSVDSFFFFLLKLAFFLFRPRFHHVQFNRTASL